MYHQEAGGKTSTVSKIWVIANALVPHSAQLSLNAVLELLVSAQALRPPGVSARIGEVLVVRYSLSKAEWEQIKVLDV